jgi:hypothetical protein
VQGQLLVAMAWSRKTDDLPRDPWYVLHSAVTGRDNGEGGIQAERIGIGDTTERR